MNIVDILQNLTDDNNLIDYPFKYCLVNDKKLPFTIKEEYCKVNNPNDFVSIYDIINLSLKTLMKYKGLGISIQGSKICAIDIDKCVEVPFSKDHINSIGLDIINRFKDFAYIEFSFSGTGLRVFFKAKIKDDYKDKYYIKNSKNHIEFYYHNGSNRYVTITGQSIHSNSIVEANSEQLEIIYKFLEDYMKKSFLITHKFSNILNSKSLRECIKHIKFSYLTDYNFQDLWFSVAPGSGKDESERDYHLIAYLYQNITTDKSLIKELFELSPFFKSKDKKHIKKWEYNNYRYFNYIFDKIIEENKR